MKTSAWLYRCSYFIILGKLSLVLLFLVNGHHLKSQENWWWMKGDSLSKQQPVYGQKGIADPLNTPGARSYATIMQDTSGDVWMFGGTGRCGAHSSGPLNDL